jgi:hypothetical protein
LHDGVAELQIGQRNFLADNRWQKTHQWLSPPDPSTNHNAACKKRQPTTGAWFVEGDQFAKWKCSSNSFLWLHGIRTYTFSGIGVLVTNRVSQLGAAKLFYGKYF